MYGLDLEWKLRLLACLPLELRRKKFAVGGLDKIGILDFSSWASAKERHKAMRQADLVVSWVLHRPIEAYDVAHLITMARYPLLTGSKLLKPPHIIIGSQKPSGVYSPEGTFWNAMGLEKYDNRGSCHSSFTNISTELERWVDEI